MADLRARRWRRPSAPTGQAMATAAIIMLWIAAADSRLWAFWPKQVS